VAGRRKSDNGAVGGNGTNVSKLSVPIGSVPQIVIWVLSLAAAWYGVQSQLRDIQASIRVISTQMEGDTKLNDRDMANRDAKIREIEVNMKAYDIRIRALETDMAARKGVR
jgi:hypothetical protein